MNEDKKKLDECSYLTLVIRPNRVTSFAEISSFIENQKVLFTGAIRKSSADISDECLHCICMVESDCKDPKCVMDLGSLSCGPYQIKDPYWDDCGKPGPSWKECASNKTCAEYCMRQYRIRYQNRIGHCSRNCEFQARLHNGGPNGCTTRKNSTDVYWAKVKKCLETGLPWR